MLLYMEVKKLNFDENFNIIKAPTKFVISSEWFSGLIFSSWN